MQAEAAAGKRAVGDMARPGEEERGMLREALRGFLARAWVRPENADRVGDPDAIAEIWRGLCGQGVAGLGRDRAEGGLAEMLVVMEELGRAACRAPLPAAFVANLACGGRQADAAQLSAFLDAVQDGRAIPALAFGPQDLDRDGGRVAVADGAATGELRHVEAGEGATHLLFADGEGDALLLADVASAGVERLPARAMGAGGQAHLRLDRVPALRLALPPGRLAELRDIHRLCLAARALGAVDAGFGMAVDWAKERRQFGKPIGSFQAVQHKLADNLMILEAARLSLANAAACHDRGDATWRSFGAAAFAFAADRLRKAALENHHAMGAVGYAEAHALPGLTKFAHLDLVAHGGLRRAREELAARYLAPDAAGLPEHDLGADGNAFRQEVRAWLQDHWVGARKAAFDARPFHQREYDPEFARDLGRTGWIALGWPKAFGGQARGPLEQLAFVEEMERVEAPRTGAAVQAAMLMVSGTPEQQAALLPAIARGEAVYGMGYSEPEAGSDLASLRTRAERDGDGWVINGQKIWTTTYWGDFMLLATRTDPDAEPRHAGITMFLVPMDSPGITVKPMKTMYDGTFANIFYDDVRVPDSARVGAVNGGWKVLTGALSSERSIVSAGIIAKVAHDFDTFCAWLRAEDGGALAADPWVRDRIGDLAAQIEACRLLSLRCVELTEAQVTPPHYAAMVKVQAGELMERFGETALDIAGRAATLSEDCPGAMLRGRIEQKLRHSLMWVISIGTNEIQRTLIATRGLGLPR